MQKHGVSLIVENESSPYKFTFQDLDGGPNHKLEVWCKKKENEKGQVTKVSGDTKDFLALEKSLREHLSTKFFALCAGTEVRVFTKKTTLLVYTIITAEPFKPTYTFGQTNK